MAAVFQALYKIFLAIISPLWIAGMGLVSCFGLDSCGAEPPNAEWVEKAFHLQLDGATVDSSWDTHGGFHGDGNTYIALSLVEGIEEQISSKNAEYQDKEKDGPWYSINEYPTVYTSLLESVRDFREGGVGTPISIEIENGYFAAINNFDGKDEFIFLSEDTPLGGFWNWEFVLYDADALKLYYYESDM